MALILRKLHLWCPPWYDLSNAAIKIRHALTSLERFPQQMKFIALKTWSNNWITAHHAQQTLLPCAICREECDTMSHYLSCHTLWDPIHELFQAF